jgi:hypothetical protein
MMRALLIVSLAFGCARSEVDVTATFDSSIDDTTLMQLVDLLVTASGAESSQAKLQLTAEVRQSRSGRFIYRAAANSGSLDLDLRARDSNQGCLAHGAKSGIALEKGQAVAAAITLTKGCPGESQADMGGCNALFCDDFELGMLDRSKWEAITDSLITAGVDDTKAHGGSFSLHVHVDSETTSGDFHNAYITTTTPSDPLHVRAFVFIPSATANLEPGLLDARQVSGAFADIALSIGAGHTITVGDTVDPPFTLHSSSMIPVDRWVCLEWVIAFTGAVDTHTSIDGSELGELHGSGPGIMPSFGQLRVGAAFLTSAGTPPLDLWFDDIVLDDKPIGCK